MKKSLVAVALCLGLAACGGETQPLSENNGLPYTQFVSGPNKSSGIAYSERVAMENTFKIVGNRPFESTNIAGSTFRVHRATIDGHELLAVKETSGGTLRPLLDGSPRTFQIALARRTGGCYATSTMRWLLNGTGTGDYVILLDCSEAG
ncbi:MAG: hypothetical protein AAFQ51_16870 [Pseudomonadota bacterium]